MGELEWHGLAASGLWELAVSGLWEPRCMTGRE